MASAKPIYPPGEPDFDLADFLPFAMRKFVLDWTRAFEEFSVGRHNLTIAEVRFLILQDQHAFTRLDLLQQRADVTAVQISRSLAATTASGLVNSRKDPQDGRRTLVKLTSRGRAVREEAVAFARALQAEIIANAPDVSPEALVSTIRAFTSALAKRSASKRATPVEAAAATNSRERRRSRAP